MLKLLGVAILVRGTVVRGPVVLEVRCLEQALPMRGGSKPWRWSWSIAWVRAWMDGVAGVSTSSCWRSVVACWGACRYNMGNVSAHEAQYAGAAVMVAEVSPRPPTGILAASRRVVRHDRTARSWSWAYCLVVVDGNMRSK